MQDQKIKMKKILATLVVLISIVSISQSQPNFPETGPLYDDSVVPRIDITINPDTLDWLYESGNLESDIEFSARFVFNNGTIIDTIEPVGFRLRGNTSRYSPKKSFKVSFNRFTQGGKYYGVEKLNLNGEHNDPSIMRAKICWDMLRKWEIAAPRSNHVEVYINGDYYGLYLNTEHIDEEFVKSRFGYNDGNLYKCLYPANLNYLGSDPDLYKLTNGNNRVYELKINEELDDYSDFAHFVDVLNNTPNDELLCELEKVFNVDDYLKMIAADILIGNWDGPIYNQNNFYLYHNTVTGKFEYIPYDLDNTLGIDWLDRDWATRDIYDWQQHGDNYRPVYERLMNNQVFRDQYSFYMKKLTNEFFDWDSLKNVYAERIDFLTPYVADDPYYPLSYGYTVADFQTSLTGASGGHVDYGVFPYLDKRIEYNNLQLENNLMKPVIKYIAHQRESASKVWVRAKVDVQAAPAAVHLIYHFNGGPDFQTMMYDDGNHNDADAGDGIYGSAIDNIPDMATSSYQIDATDANNMENLQPCEFVLIPSAGSSDAMLYINEFMASNSTNLADEYGDFDDWIEVYNAGAESVWLGDIFLTDNLSSPDKWQMPDAYIEAGGFQLFWADGETDQGPFHASFKLSKDGEELGIFDASQTAIDEYVFGPQENDISEGRYPNGADNWVFFERPTPGSSNEYTDVQEFHDDILFLYPNPSKGGKVMLNKTTNFNVFNMMGKLVYKAEKLDFFNTESYNKGLYIVVTDDGYTTTLIVQ